MVCPLVGAKPLSEQMLKYQLDPKEQTFKRNSYIFIQEMHLNVSSAK